MDTTPDSAEMGLEEDAKKIAHRGNMTMMIAEYKRRLVNVLVVEHFCNAMFIVLRHVHHVTSCQMCIVSIALLIKACKHMKIQVEMITIVYEQGMNKFHVQ